MIYFSPTIRAKDAQISDLQARLDASEAERRALLDRLLTKNRVEPVTESPKAQVVANPQVIAPPWAGFSEIQDAQKQVWIEEEVTYLIDNLAYDETRARLEAERLYNEQHSASLV